MNDRLGGTTTSLDAGNIRYYGKNPSNYIYFNCSDYSNQTSNTCELWRIIGVFGDKLKLVRNDSIGNYSWDSNNTNDWTTATLQTYLNNEYYNELRNDITRNKITKVIWKLGGHNNIAAYSNQIYESERGTNVWGSRPTEWEGKLALMYPSDYGYGTDFNKCVDNLDNYDSSADSYACRTNDWIFNSEKQWLLTPNSGDSFGVNDIFLTGYACRNGNSSIRSEATVRPTLFLNTNEVISSGTGTSTDPYRLK